MVKTADKDVMQIMAKLAIEQATSQIAKMAMECAESLPDGISGREALIVFAESILSTNEKVFPKGKAS